MKENRSKWMVFTTFILFLCLPTFAYADAGIPMIVLTYPAMILLLIPVSIIEAVVYSQKLGITFKNTMWPSFVSNLVSTIVGIPIAWLLLLLIELVTTFGRPFDLSTFFGQIMTVALQSAWFMPPNTNAGSAMSWMLPLTFVVGLIPAFFISIWIEARIVMKFFKEKDGVEIKKVVKKANIYSYGALIILCIILAVVSKVILYPIFQARANKAEEMELVKETNYIKLHPADDYAYFTRGLHYDVLHDSKKALADYSKAIEINPNYGTAYQMRAKIYYALKEYDKSWSDVHKAEKFPFGSSDFRFISDLQKASGRDK